MLHELHPTSSIMIVVASNGIARHSRVYLFHDAPLTGTVKPNELFGRSALTFFSQAWGFGLFLSIGVFDLHGDQRHTRLYPV